MYMTGKIHSIEDWSWSAGKQSIALYSNFKLHEKPPEPPILMIGGVHGDEPEGVWLAEDLLEHLKQSKSPQKPWVLIPCINPDGISKNQRTNANGVDLNRNFPSKCWNNSFTKERYYPGDSPNSEPETQALCNLIREIGPLYIIHFHSWKPMVVYSNTKVESQAKVIAEKSGYELQNDIGYPTPGSLGEYAGKDLDIGVICIEEQDHYPVDKKHEVFARFKPAFDELLFE